MKIFSWFYRLRVRLKGYFLGDPIMPVAHTTTQEDPRDIEAVKRFNASFDQQQQKIQTRSFAAHEASCVDTFTCQGCFKYEPNVIASEVYESESAEKVTARKKRFKLKLD
jgi:hypothetical protein